MEHNYSVYFTTNPTKTVLYVGVTNNIPLRIRQHYENRGQPETFADRYHAYKLIYVEHYIYVNEAIDREKQIKRWSRKKKEWLINKTNPGWKFLDPWDYR